MIVISSGVLRNIQEVFWLLVLEELTQCYAKLSSATVGGAIAFASAKVKNAIGRIGIFCHLLFKMTFCNISKIVSISSIIHVILTLTCIVLVNMQQFQSYPQPVHLSMYNIVLCIRS